MNTTSFLKGELWKNFGAKDQPCEWDGNVYGGGKMSQRYWEYFQAIELLNLGKDSVVLDIGGGSPVTGCSFFGALLARAVKTVFVMDGNANSNASLPHNIICISKSATYDELKSFLKLHPVVTHVVSISVFEHIETSVRKGIVEAIDEEFKGETFVVTLEYHAKSTFFEHQLTARTLSGTFTPLTKYYLDTFTSSPVWCENAFDQQRFFKLSRRALVAKPSQIPRWYPLALKFLRF